MLELKTRNIWNTVGLSLLGPTTPLELHLTHDLTLSPRPGRGRDTLITAFAFNSFHIFLDFMTTSVLPIMGAGRLGSSDEGAAVLQL